MKLEQICELIELPEEMRRRVMEEAQRLGVSSIYIETQQKLMQEDSAVEDLYLQINRLRHQETWQQGLDGLRETLGEDKDGARMLACMLQCALGTYKEYVRLGISEAIYIATMKAFSRFVGEHKASYGSYGFDRAFWTPRQLSCVLFRLGELEYELTEWKREKVVSIHIPSDAKLAKECVDASLAAAEAFVKKYFPEYISARYHCDSWLLSPELKKILPTESNIINFQNRFRITEVDRNQEDVLEWVFKNVRCSVEELPENTSLQRKVKEMLLRGKK